MCIRDSNVVLGKLALWAIYFACVNFFRFLLIVPSPIISGSIGPIFALNNRYLFVDDRSGPLSQFLKGLKYVLFVRYYEYDMMLEQLNCKYFYHEPS